MVPTQLLGRRTPNTASGIVWGKLQALGFETYGDYIRSPLWHRKQAAYRADPALPQSCICGAEDVQLHHRTYERLGAENLTDLYPLCSKCHGMLHVYVRRGLVSGDVDPEYFADADRSERYAADLDDAVERARRELASPVRLELLNRGMVSKLCARASEIRRLREHKERRTKVRAAVGAWPRRCDLATAEDMKQRIFEP